MTYECDRIGDSQLGENVVGGILGKGIAVKRRIGP